MEKEGKLLQEASSHRHCPPYGSFSSAWVSMKCFSILPPILGSVKSLGLIHFYERVCANNSCFSPLWSSELTQYIYIYIYIYLVFYLRMPLGHKLVILRNFLWKNEKITN